MKKFFGAITGVVVALSASVASAADLALIIAQERYDSLGNLANVSSEANAMQNAYKADGFDVMLVRDGRDSQIISALQKFEAEMAGRDRLVIHYMGRLSVSGQNLRMLPKNAKRLNLTATTYAGHSIDVLYELLGRRPGRSALVLETPTEDMRLALAKGPRITQGVLVLSGPVRATAGIVRNQLLASDIPPATIRQNNPSLVVTGFVNDLPFETPLETLRAPEPQVMAPEPNDAFAEMAAWRAATNAGTKDALEGYLSSYPNGMFVSEATARLDALVPAEQRAEAALNLSRNERRQIQRNLTLLGFNTRGVDGIFGRGSRQAIQAWQTSERFRASGFLDVAQIRVLQASADARQQEMDRQAEQDKAARDAADLALWQRTGASGREADLRAYLSEYPEGLFASQAARALATIQERSGVQQNAAAEATESRLGLNQRTRLLIEQRLAGLKINPGPVDGKFDGNTRRAIAQFQQRVGLTSTGYLTNETVGQLIASVFR